MTHETFKIHVIQYEKDIHLSKHQVQDAFFYYKGIKCEPQAE